MISLDLAGEQAIITGSTWGIGYAIANGMAEAGASVERLSESDPRLICLVRLMGFAASQPSEWIRNGWAKRWATLVSARRLDRPAAPDVQQQVRLSR